MENSEGIEWDVRPDGVYLKVSKEASRTVKVEDFKKQLDAQMVMGYDWKRIKEVLVRGSGRDEFVGKRMNHFEEQKLEYVGLSITPQEVSVQIKETIDSTGLELTVQDFEYLLARKEVVHGVDWSQISEIIRKKMYGESICVAKATPAEHGKDSKLDVLVQIESNFRPSQRANGTVDFKHLDNIHQVEAGTDLVRKYPPTAGKPGTDVFGKTIPPRPGKDLPFPVGDNTAITKDGTRLVASKSGFLYQGQKGICIGELFVVKQDVCYETGNIDYEGDVIVCGDVLTGFSIKAGGNVRVDGTVEGATIESTGGSVEVANGFFGRGKGKIQAKEDIKLKMAQDGEIICGGTLTVRKSMRNCNVQVKSLDGSAPGCTVSGGQLEAQESVHLFSLGAAGVKTAIAIVDEQSKQIRAKIDEMEVVRDKVQLAAEGHEKRLKSMQAMVKKMGNVSGNAMNNVVEEVNKFKLVRKKLTFIEEQIGKLEKELETPSDLPGSVVLEKKVESTTLQMYDSLIDLGQEHLRKKIFWSTEGLQVQSM